ncbi:class I SAM-dependent methyltransferase [Salegentibacter chungangensis]|uniref:Class I SAM-dependent methyltransferase n=1 Tax=Salegentibacter chungangensis TaxID=1335724 RepID=A0ABW3NT81_9FLAO
MKDNFSTKSEDYAKFRPGYPAEVFRFIENHLRNKEKAWDCGTGNGQVAEAVSEFMERVEATDISRRQLENAVAKPNIYYSRQSAEKTKFPDESFDLVTVGQAIHWFNFDEFYGEVKRLLKPGGLIAVLGYSLFNSNPETDEVILKFYKEIIGPFWDPERKYLDEKYQSIPFPFDEIGTPQFESKVSWSFEHLIGYLRTWSAVKHYENSKNHNPVDLISEELYKAYGDYGEISFPILFRLGRK